MELSSPKIKVLHLLLLPSPETNATYNEHCLPMVKEREIAICTYFKFTGNNPPPSEIKFFEGDNTFFGFWHTLKLALQEGEYDIIHAHTPHVAVILLILLFLTGKGQLLAKTVYTVHNSYPNYKIRNKLLLIPIFALFKRIVCCSKSSRASFPSFFKKLAGDRLLAVPNGVDLKRIDTILNQQSSPNDHNKNPNLFNLITIGRLVKIKNSLLIVKAFAQMAKNDPESSLTLIGKGNLKTEIEQEINKMSLEKQVKLTGLIPRNDVYQYLTQADVFISASWGEGLPLATLEAMACSCPVILSEIEPHQEIAEGVDFIPLIKPDDVAGFTEAIQRLRTMSPAERLEIGTKCRKLVEDKFSLKIMHKNYDQVYTQITE